MTVPAHSDTGRHEAWLRGHIRKQHDLRVLITMSSLLSSISHVSAKASRPHTEGANNRMSSAYRMTQTPGAWLWIFACVYACRRQYIFISCWISLNFANTRDHRERYLYRAFYCMCVSVIFVLIYFLVLVLVLVFQLFFRFSFVLVFIIISF